MKKSVLALMVAGMICFSGAAAEAANTRFSDVPANHWAYGAATKLVQAGILEGYGNGTFQGEKTLNRYEMAIIVANALTKEEKASAENKVLIEKLAHEFADELQSLGARVVNLEKDKEKFHYFGIFGNRYDHMNKEGVTDKSNVFILNTSYKINDQFTFVTTSEMHRMYKAAEEQWVGNSGDQVAPDSTSDWNNWGLQVYVDGTFGGFKTKLGRFTYLPSYGIAHSEYLQVSGAQVSFGNKLKTTLTAGENTQYVPGGTYASMGYQAIEAAYPLKPDTNIKLSYQRNQSNLGLSPAVAPHDNDYFHYIEGGFDTKITKNLAFEAACIKSSYDADNKGYYAQLKYKNAIPFVPKSYDFYVAYHKLESNSIMYNDLRYYSNMKGVRVGAHYAPWDSTLLTVWYDMQKYINAGTSQPTSGVSVDAGQKDNFFRAQLDFFFK